MKQLDKYPPLIVLVGQTATGKSALAMQIALRFNAEIICADSWTVRREVSIGAAKASDNDRKLIKHHLIDIVGPEEKFTAAIFKELAAEAIEDISARGKVALLVGGTGLYIDGILYDYQFLPVGVAGLRDKLNELTISELLDRIIAAGIPYEGVDIRNKRRLIRLIETNGRQPKRGQAIRPNTFLIGIKMTKDELSKRIEARVDAMIAAGLEDEVRQLADRYGWQCEALKGIGYREWQAYFSHDQSLDVTRQSIIKSTKSLAKRQQTWFKRNKSIHWVSTPVSLTEVVDLLTNI